MGQLLDTLLFMLCSLAITVGIGILLAFYYAKRNYAPIKKLASLSPTMQSDTAEIDEFTIIEESFQNLSSENDVLKNSIKAHMPMIRNNLLNKLLSNTRFEPADRKNLERYSIVFPEKHFVVSVVGIEIMNLHSEEALGGTPASSAVFFTYIEEYFKNANFIAYLTETQNGNYALILNCTDEQVKEYRSVLTKLLDFIRSKLSFDVEADISMGVSSIKEDPQNMKQLYYQALNALEYGYSMPATENDDATETPNIIWFDDLNEKQKVSYNFTYNDELKLMNLMKSSQKEETLAFTNSVLDDFFAQGRIKREDAIYIYNQILFICAKVIHETNARVTDIVDFKHLLSLSLFTQMNEYTLDCVSKTCDIIGQQQKSSEHELSGRILQYVRDNFRNYELTLTYIADHFHVSAIYVSKAVKKVSNISFIDYLNRLRIDEAKQMLSESDTSIRDIATAVGYDSDKNFIRVFKKYEGITPDSSGK